MYTLLLFLSLILTSQCTYNGDTSTNILIPSTGEMAAITAPITPYTNVLRKSLPLALRPNICLATSSIPYLQSRSSSIQSIQPKKSYTYRLAAASSAKRTPPRQAQYNRDFFLHTTTSSLNSSSPQEEPYIRSTKAASGEDAFFATRIGHSTHSVAFGVADGVGGWQDQGVDPSDFSHALCGLMAGTAHLWDEGAEKRKLRPLGLLQTAYDAVMGNPRILAGGSTASLAVIDESGEVEAANLGFSFSSS